MEKSLFYIFLGTGLYYKMGVIKYHDGDKVGPYHHILLKRLYKTPSKHWMCRWQCGWCHKGIFETTIDHVTRKKYLSCGCQDEKVKQRKRERLQQYSSAELASFGKKAREQNSPYQIGTK